MRPCIVRRQGKYARRRRDYSRPRGLCNRPNMNFYEPISGLIERIARALERLGPQPIDAPDFGAGDAFVWQADSEAFLPVRDINRLPLDLLKGIDRQRDTLLHNTKRFARGLPANNALLWGARGMGKSSLVKAVHGEVSGLKLVEIHRGGYFLSAAPPGASP